MSFPSVICVIVNMNRREDTLALLGSIRGSSRPNLPSIVLDVNSTDGSASAVKEQFPEVTLIDIRDNNGYAGNNNVGVSAALARGAEWVFILNEDTILAHDCIERLVTIGQRDLRIGVLGPMVYHHEAPDVIQSAGGTLGKAWESLHIGRNEVDTGQFGRARQVGWISGCGMLLRREMIEEVGLMDERFFCYWEETDWCHRAALAGWKIVHVPDAHIWHKGVTANYQPQPFVTYYSTRNRLLFLRKHHAPLGAWLRTGLAMSRTLASWTLRPRWKSHREHKWAMLHGVRDFLRDRWGRMPS